MEGENERRPGQRLEITPSPFARTSSEQSSAVHGSLGYSLPQSLSVHLAGTPTRMLVTKTCWFLTSLSLS